MKSYKTVDAYIKGNERWTSELEQLRKILNGTPLEETVKWGGPCYTYGGKNLVGIGAFKTYFGLWFHQGALLSDEAQVLQNAQEGKTKALRQWRMTSKKDIKARTIKAYVKEAIELQTKGKEIKPDRNKPLIIPPELKKALSKNTEARTVFEKLTKGRQREYADYIAEAKRDATKASRLKKILPMITAGASLHDKYRS